MRREVLLDSLCGQTRLAVLEDGVLCELYAERADSRSLSGNIYVGKVENVLPGMNAAFVDVGLDKNGFLYADDIDTEDASRQEMTDNPIKRDIRKLVRPGQELPVQVVKEPGGTKGPRLSCHITLPGRLLALMPVETCVGVSRKIEDPNERTRLQEIGKALVEKSGLGLVLRTAAEGQSEDAIREEYEILTEQWSGLSRRGKAVKAPALICSGASLVDRAVQDMLKGDTEAILTDDPALYDALKRQAGACENRIRLYQGTLPLFDAYQVDADYEKALRHQVWLKSGGYLVIDFTEALTVIDVNTGKFVGRSSLEETILKTNCEAAVEIARQLRLRDIGGIVIVDFIDMKSTENRKILTDVLQDELKRDPNRTVLEGMTGLGLMEITRKKKRLSTQKIRTHICGTCGGTGFVDDYEAVAWRILYDLRRRAKQSPDQAYDVRCHEAIVTTLVAIGAPDGVKVHLTADRQAEGEYEILPLDPAQLPKSAKLLPIRTNGDQT